MREGGGMDWERCGGTAEEDKDLRGWGGRGGERVEGADRGYVVFDVGGWSEWRERRG